jgi:hypothetical protein
MAHESRFAFTLLVIVLLVMALALTLGTAEARASDGGMPGMPGMTNEEMQNMGQPAATPAASGADAHRAETVMDPHMAMGGGSVNWLVIGGFIALVVGSTIGAVATKRNLARRMASGELAGAGALDV